jgi:hypothetical protein
MRRSLVLGIAAIGGSLVTASPAVARPPELVSPLGLSAERCPTFSWSEVSGATGYELVVYPLSGEGSVGDQPLVSVRLPGGVGSWTPPVESCVAAGGRYAWTLRALGTAGEGGWSEPALFEVDEGPSTGEVEAAIATLRRYLADSRGSKARPGEAAAGELPQADRRAPPGARSTRARQDAPTGVQEAWVFRREAEPSLASVTAASAPALGSPSLTVDANVALGGASNLFKAGSVFLWDDTTGNTALGRLALSSANAAANQNTAVGWEALRYTIAVAPQHGSYNTALGYGALRSNTTGYANTASGHRALFLNTTGFRNTASGFSALFANSTGSHNTAIGNYSLRTNLIGSNNTATGSRALQSNSTGGANTASGSFALFYNSTGSANAASGFEALSSNTTGSRNTATGSHALFWNTTGFRNSATGSYALFSNTTGSRNTASGYKTLFSNTTGSYSSASGYKALYNATAGGNTATGSLALSSNTTGARNTAIGSQAGAFATTGTDNIFLGYGAFGDAGDTNTIRIGGLTGSAPGQQNRTIIAGIRGITTGAADAVAVLIDGGGQLGTVSSSREVKQDIREIGELSRRLLALRPVAFRYRQHAKTDPDTPLQFGLIAEEVAEVFPELVVRDGEGKPETVRYHLLAALLLNELQREHQINDSQHAELVALRNRVAALERGGSDAVQWPRELRHVGGGSDAPSNVAAAPQLRP